MRIFNCHVSKESIKRVKDVLRSGRLSEGPVVAEFEQEIEKKLGLRNPVALNSGTSALHLALVLAGVQPGDEVILPAQTFIATGMAVLMCRAVPVFADVSPVTGCILPDSVARCITSKTKAVIAVDWGGLPCHYYSLKEISSPAALIVDAAHSLGAWYRGVPVGAVPDVDCFCFSLQATKLLTSGDGGILCALGTKHNVQEAFRRRWFGIPRDAEFNELGERDYDVTDIGFKYHMNDVAAAIALGNLEDLPQRLFRRQQIARMYRDKLSGIPTVKLPPIETDRTHAYYFFSILCDNRDELARRLDCGLCSVVCRRIDRFSVFGGIRDNLRGQKEYDERHLALPVHEAISDHTIEYITNMVRRYG